DGAQRDRTGRGDVAEGARTTRAVLRQSGGVDRTHRYSIRAHDLDIAQAARAAAAGRTGDGEVARARGDRQVAGRAVERAGELDVPACGAAGVRGVNR